MDANELLQQEPKGVNLDDKLPSAPITPNRVKKSEDGGIMDKEGDSKESDDNTNMLFLFVGFLSAFFLGIKK